MPQYVFARVDKPSVKQDLFYTMKAVPSVGSVVTIDGVKWKRIFTKPRMSVDTQVDPFSAKDFIKATNKKDCVGALWDRSKELSLKRRDKEGEDSVRRKFFDNYSRRRKGAKHPEQRREESVKTLAQKGIHVDWGDDD